MKIFPINVYEDQLLQEERWWIGIYCVSCLQISIEEDIGPAAWESRQTGKQGLQPLYTGMKLSDKVGTTLKGQCHENFVLTETVGV